MRILITNDDGIYAEGLWLLVEAVQRVAEPVIVAPDREQTGVGTAVSLLQVYAFLAIAWFWEIEAPPLGYVAALPALVLSGLMLGALGMLISSAIKQLENFAGVMNFVIFPMFFASSALYPLWRVQEGSPLLYYVCQFNPFTHVVELIRFALYMRIDWLSLAVVAGCTALFMIGAILAYDPSRGFLARRGEPGGGA